MIEAKFFTVGTYLYKYNLTVLFVSPSKIAHDKFYIYCPPLLLNEIYAHVEVQFRDRVWETGLDGLSRFGKQSGKHWSPHFRTSLVHQDIWGSWRTNQGRQRMISVFAFSRTSNLMSSSCRLPMRSVIGYKCYRTRGDRRGRHRNPRGGGTGGKFLNR